jgi:hypothetical protein
MINNYLEPKEFRIDISELYRCVKSNRENIDTKLILEFRNRAEDFMIYNEDIKPEVPFDKTNWENIKSKYQYYVEETIEGDFVNVDYFFARIPIKKNLFENNEKEIFENSRPLRAGMQLGNVQASNKKTKSHGLIFKGKGDKEPRYYSDNWWDYSYDIYSYFQLVNVPADFANPDFQYFFAWYWTLLDPLQITPSFLEMILKKTGKSEKLFFDYLDVLNQKFIKIFENSLWDLNKDKIMNISNNTKEVVSKNKKGRPSKDYLINRPISREINDGKTTLVTEATAYLFAYLQKSGVILSKKDGLSKVDFSLIISALCGYTPTNINKNLSILKKNKIELNNIKNELELVIELINRDLKVN